MFLKILAGSFYLLAFIAALKMESFMKGFLFILVILGVSGLLYLFILFPGISGISVAVMLGAFILKQGRK